MHFLSQAQTKEREGCNAGTHFRAWGKVT